LAPSYKLLFDTYFNQENSNEVNAALLEILQQCPDNKRYYAYVKDLA
jgi:hypothetical protein